MKTLVSKTRIETNIYSSLLAALWIICAVVITELLALFSRIFPPSLDLIGPIGVVHGVMLIPACLFILMFQFLPGVGRWHANAVSGSAVFLAGMVLLSGERGMQNAVVLCGIPMIVLIAGFLFSDPVDGQTNSFPFVAGGVVASLLAKGSLLRHGNWSNLVWAAVVIMVMSVTQYVVRHRSKSVSTHIIAGFCILVVVIAIGIGWNSQRDHWVMQPAGKPDRSGVNVAVIMLDAARLDVIAPGFENRTAAPGFVEWASHHGGVRPAVAPAPSTLPSTATLFTGLPTSHHGAHRSKRDDPDPPEFGYALKPDIDTLADRFGAAGYVTAAISGNYAAFDPHYGLHQGFHYYSADRNEAGRFVRKMLLDRCYPVRRCLESWSFPAYGYVAATPYRNAETIVDEAISVVHRMDDRPFFMFVNIFDAHSPYIPPDYWAIRRKYADTGWILQGEPLADFEERMIHDGVPLLPDQTALLRELYAAEVQYLDAHLMRLLNALDSETTLIVVLADHGEFLGEHSMMKHSTSLYHELLDVPMVISEPPDLESLAGKTPPPNDFLNLHDEILKAGGITPPTRVQMNGVVSETFSARHPVYPFGRRQLYEGDLRSVERTPWKLIAADQGYSQLFNLETDPGESINLIEAHPEIAKQLQLELESMNITGQSNEAAADSTEEISDDMREELEVLGYLQ